MAKPVETTPRFKRIADGMVRVVAERGLEGATVEAIVAAAAVPREEFEALFADKQDCFDRVWEQMSSDFRRDLCRAYAGHRPWRQRLRSAARFVLDYFQADVSRSTFFIIGTLTGGELAQARRDGIMELGIDIVDGGREELDDPDSMSRLTAEGVVGAIYEAVIAAVSKGDPNVGDALLRQLMYLAVFPYLGREVAMEELRGEAD